MYRGESDCGPDGQESTQPFAEAAISGPEWEHARRRPRLDHGGRASKAASDRYEAVAVTMSVRLAGSPVPTANSGRKLVPALARPSYSPTK
jgi:hypothetical protein